MNPSEPARYAPAAFLVLLAVNVLVFVIQLVKGVDLMRPDVDQLIAWGANKPLLTLNGQPWRLLTSMFLHIGLIHLAANCYMLKVLGPIVEREFGTVRFTLVYLLSGLFGSLASALWTANADKVSAGASGALMGITGACLAHSLVAYVRDKQGFAASLLMPLAQTIAINLAFGAMVKGVDNACHVGGLLSGAVIGGIFALTRFEDNGLMRSVVAAIVSIASLALLNLAVN